MIKLFIYFETLILSTLYKLVKSITNFVRDYLTNINDTAEWYAENNLHFYQFKKAHELYMKQLEDCDAALRKYLEKEEEK